MGPPTDLQEVLESEIKYVIEISRAKRTKLDFLPQGSGIFVCYTYASSNSLLF